MVSSTATPTKLTPRKKRAQELALESATRLARHTSSDLEIVLPTSCERLTLPAEGVRLLVAALGHLAAGHAVSVFPHRAELTTQQAADFLGVSRPFVVKLLETGEVAFRRIGAHRRIVFKDLLAYRDEISRKRSAVLDVLSQQAQEENLGY